MIRTEISLEPLTPTELLRRRCLEHLAREEAQLEDTLVALQAIRTALLGRDPTALGTALSQQETIAHDGEQLAEGRRAFSQRAAEILGLKPGAISLSTLARHFPPETARRIDTTRFRLRRLAAEVDELNRHNASLLYYNLDFLRRFFDDLTGRPRDGRYGPSGALHSASSGALINAQG